MTAIENIAAQGEWDFKAFLDLRALTATMIVHMVPPVPYATLLRFDFFQMSHEIPYFARRRKMSYKKVSKKQTE